MPPLSATASSQELADSAAQIAAETAAALGTPPVTASPAPTSAPAAPAPVAESASGLSTENDFAAVSEQRSIGDDAAHIASNRQQYEVVQPTPLPERSGDTGPNIVNYALQTSHPRGTQMYKRSGLNMAARTQRNCHGYPSPDQAQIDFLAKGGPERDRMGLDPDGDGYACSWNPEPFRRAASN